MRVKAFDLGDLEEKNIDSKSFSFQIINIRITNLATLLTLLTIEDEKVLQN